MKRFSVSSDVVTMIVLIVAVIVGIGYWFVALRGNESSMNGPETKIEEDTKTYSKVSDFPNPEKGDRAEIEQKLLAAFIGGTLMEGGRFPIPQNSGQELVFASPSLSGKAEKIDCGVQSHALCALYLVEKTRPPRLLLWGSRMTGFTGIEQFIDERRAMISTTWTLYNFTSIERHVLDLSTGDLQPKLLIEIDKGDTFVEMRASGFGGVVTFLLRGERGGMGLIPQEIAVRNQGGQTTDVVTTEKVKAYADMVTKSQNRIEALAVEAIDIDTDKLLIPLSLYGESITLDLQKGSLTPTTAFSR